MATVHLAPKPPSHAMHAPRQTRRSAATASTHRPFAIGLETSRVDLGDQTHRQSTASSPVFVRSIMYKAVSARSFQSVVDYDASISAIARRFAVSEHDVRMLWLPSPPPPSAPHVASTRRRPPPAGLDARRFQDLFAERPPLDPDVTQFAHSLIARLNSLQRQRSPVRLQKRKPDALLSPVSHADAVRESCPPRSCGFARARSHKELEVLCQGLAIVKKGRGLYRTACGCCAMRPGADGHYFEVVVVEDGGVGGVCVGVTCGVLPLNKLIGSDDTSVGLHSSGQIVSRGGQFQQFGRAFKSGDRVGCAVCVKKMGVERGDDAEEFVVQLTYFINGLRQGSVCEAVWQHGADDRAVYPAVSLYKAGSKAIIQCCRKDWKIDMESLGEELSTVLPVCSGVGEELAC